MQAPVSHVSVMPREIIQLVRDALVERDQDRPCRVLDGTVGQGGHSELILQNTPDWVTVVGTDRDGQAVQAASERLRHFGPRFKAIWKGYDQATDIVTTDGIGFDAILLDLGQSSTQYELGRGFSFSAPADEPLDMRYDTREELTAERVIIDTPVAVLAERFRELAQVPMAGRLARILKEEAGKNRMRTVGQFVAVCLQVYGPRIRKMASPTLPMQALRIMVNQELERLEGLFDALPDVLREGGRLITCSFHSGEDRICKTRMRQYASMDGFSLPFRKAIKPSFEECAVNPRARSTRLRALDRDEARESARPYVRFE